MRKIWGMLFSVSILALLFVGGSVSPVSVSAQPPGSYLITVVGETTGTYNITEIEAMGLTEINASTKSGDLYGTWGGVLIKTLLDPHDGDNIDYTFNVLATDGYNKNWTYSIGTSANTILAYKLNGTYMDPANEGWYYRTMTLDSDDGDYSIYNISTFTLYLDVETTTSGTSVSNETLPDFDYSPNTLYLVGIGAGGVVLLLAIVFLFMKKPGNKGKILALLLSILAITGMGFSAIGMINFVPVAVDAPEHLHLTWEQDNTSHVMTAVWQTNTSIAGDVVKYDTVSRGGNPGLYVDSVTGMNFTYASASGIIHVTQMTDLLPDTVYYFVVGGDKGGWSGENKFKTAAVDPDKITIISGGDSRVQIRDDDPTGHDMRDKVSGLLSLYDVDFVAYSGDFVGDGWNQTEWDSWFEHQEQYWVSSDGRIIPIVPVLGNHEDNDTTYYSQFALAGNEQWYSLRYGDVYIAILDSQASLTKIQEQATWLDNDLAANQDAEWTFVMYHYNTFATGKKGRWLNGINHIVPIIDKHHVDVVLNAHSHGYFRSGPINYSKSSSTQQSSYDEGTLYLVNAGWGAPLYTAASQWWTNTTAKKYHISVIDIYNNGSLHLTTVDENNTIFDELWIHH
ncbi:MAG: purple acid phosphatase family protein [Candidatus Ranarchaeia archaeon]